MTRQVEDRELHNTDVAHRMITWIYLVLSRHGAVLETQKTLG